MEAISVGARLATDAHNFSVCLFAEFGDLAPDTSHLGMSFASDAHNFGVCLFTEFGDLAPDTPHLDDRGDHRREDDQPWQSDSQVKLRVRHAVITFAMS
jgi:hypothetical protein